MNVTSLFAENTNNGFSEMDVFVLFSVLPDIVKELERN